MQARPLAGIRLVPTSDTLVARRAKHVDRREFASDAVEARIHASCVGILTGHARGARNSLVSNAYAGATLATITQLVQDVDAEPGW